MSFERFSLPAPVAQSLRELCYEKPTLIQEKVIPLIMEGKDVVGQSETGSGKTAAFGLPLLGCIQGRGISMLVLTPTRELCAQVKESLTRLAWHLPLQIAEVYGGVGMNPQIKAMRTAQVVVATPGRLLDLIRRGAANLAGVRFLVLDEADRMFDMGFIEDVERIIGMTPRSRQTLLFSATIPLSVRHVVQKYMRAPVFVKTVAQVDKSKLREFYYEVNQDDKFSLLVHLLKRNTEGTALVFCATRRIVDKITKNLRKNGIDALAIHGGLSQTKRASAISALHKQEVSVLIATDIAARGLHIHGIKYVYNYDLPPVAEDYTHRIGRTARAGAEGDAITLLTSRDHGEFRGVQRLGHVPKRLDLPAFERIIMPHAQHKAGHGRQSRPFDRHRMGYQASHGRQNRQPTHNRQPDQGRLVQPAHGEGQNAFKRPEQGEQPGRWQGKKKPRFRKHDSQPGRRKWVKFRRRSWR
jgi:ATP-dependent RNA helicase DeaD